MTHPTPGQDPTPGQILAGAGDPHLTFLFKSVYVNVLVRVVAPDGLCLYLVTQKYDKTPIYLILNVNPLIYGFVV